MVICLRVDSREGALSVHVRPNPLVRLGYASGPPFLLVSLIPSESDTEARLMDQLYPLRKTYTVRESISYAVPTKQCTATTAWSMVGHIITTNAMIMSRARAAAIICVIFLW